MAKTFDRAPTGKGSYTLGRKGFARISAVEGIHLSSKTEEQFRDFDRKGLSASDRRRAIARTFAKPR